MSSIRGITPMVTAWLVGIAQAAASATDAARVEKWRDAAWRDSTRLPSLRGGFACHIEYLLVPPDDELNQLRAEVPGKPEHPRKAELEQFEERLRGTPTIQRFVVYSAGDDRWRCCLDLGGVWIDSAVNRGLGWTLSRDDLNIFSLADDRQEGRDPRSERNLFATPLSRLMDGGFGECARGGLLPGPMEVRGDRWTFRAATPPLSEGAAPAFQVVFSGRWDEGLERGFVDELNMMMEPIYRDGFGSSIRFANWQVDPELGVWIAGSVESRFPDGRLDARYVFDGAAAIGEGGIDAILALPTPGSVDPVRGPATFRSIFDHRDASVKILRDGVPVPAGTINPAPGASSTRDRWLRPVGWFLFGSCLCLYVWLRLRRQSLT
jgi:hypothetical protein